MDYGDDVGASNVVKLCGNFLIASTIGMYIVHSWSLPYSIASFCLFIFTNIIITITTASNITTIESISEAMALAEKHNVDRQAVMQMLSGSIFDCLIYKGYGQRVSERDHR